MRRRLSGRSKCQGETASAPRKQQQCRARRRSRRLEVQLLLQDMDLDGLGFDPILGHGRLALRRLDYLESKYLSRSDGSECMTKFPSSVTVK